MPENDARCTASGASRAPMAGSAPPSAPQSCARATSSGRCRPTWHQPQPPSLPFTLSVTLLYPPPYRAHPMAAPPYCSLPFSAGRSRLRPVR